MYQITKSDDCLKVEFRGDFDYSTVKQVLYNEMMLDGFAELNGIWLIGGHRAQLRLGDIQLLVDDFKRLYSRATNTKKMAMVVDQGFTEAIFKLIANGIERYLPISCRVFHTIDEARHWLHIEKSQVA